MLKLNLYLAEAYKRDELFNKVKLIKQRVTLCKLKLNCKRGVI